MLLIGCIFLPETPTFLYYSGDIDKAQSTLKKLRGANTNIDDEFASIRRDSEEAKMHGNAFQQLRILFSRPYRGELTVACLVAFFSQFTGINSMLYYTPELFSSLGGGGSTGLTQAVVVAAVLLAGSLTSFVIIDRVGRRPLLIVGGITLFFLQLATGLMLCYTCDPYDSGGLSPTSSRTLLTLRCLFTYSFGCSWGPLGWLVPVESQSQSTRSAAATVSVLSNFFAVFLTTQ